jgi:hypothetical protein
MLNILWDVCGMLYSLWCAHASSRHLATKHVPAALRVDKVSGEDGTGSYRFLCLGLGRGRTNGRSGHVSHPVSLFRLKCNLIRLLVTAAEILQHMNTDRRQGCSFC